MELKPTLLTIANTYCAASGMSKPRLATLLANDGKFFDRIENGGGFTVRTFERAMLWLSENWPESAEWPDGISRPERQPVPASAAE